MKLNETLGKQNSPEDCISSWLKNCQDLPNTNLGNAYNAPPVTPLVLPAQSYAQAVADGWLTTYGGGWIPSQTTYTTTSVGIQTILQGSVTAKVKINPLKTKSLSKVQKAAAKKVAEKQDKLTVEKLAKAKETLQALSKPQTKVEQWTEAAYSNLKQQYYGTLFGYPVSAPSPSSQT